MLAVLQGSCVLLALVAAGAWGWWCARQGLAWPWALAGCALALAPHAPVLALEMALARAVGRAPGVPAPTAGQWWRAWAGEVLNGWRVFGWRQPFAEQAEPDVPAQHGQVGVVLVHGYVCNRGLWAPWLQALRGRGVPATAISCAPVFGVIDDWVPAIDAAVRQMAQRTGRPPVLVGHSMGGLALRAWHCANAAEGDGAVAVAHTVSVASPHQGTWLARFGHSPNARQMRQRSAWLQALGADEAARGGLGAAFSCVYSHCDNIVFPAETALLPGAAALHVPGAAHVQLLFRPEVLALVLQRVDAAQRGAQAGVAGA